MPLAILGLITLGAALLFIAVTRSKPGGKGRGAAKPNHARYEKSEDGKVVYIFRDAVDVDAEVVEEVEVTDSDKGDKD
jgi:hypothetical protein